MEAGSTRHASSVPAAVRNAFLELVEAESQGESACRLLDQLVDCADVLPYEYCQMLGIVDGSTFGMAARHVRASLGCDSVAE